MDRSDVALLALILAFLLSGLIDVFVRADLLFLKAFFVVGVVVLLMLRFRKRHR